MPLTGDKIVQHKIYQRLIRPILFRLDAETAHRLTLAMLARWPARRPSADPSELAVNLFGLRFANPVGLAAGMDKDARAIAAWQSLGFGFAELGTITPRPQTGNPRPRIWRLPEKHAMINRLGFPGEGMEVAARRIEAVRRRLRGMRIALNFGPNKETPPEEVAADYASLMARCGSLADFVVVNLSSPNTPGLRDWQAPERIRAIVEALRSVGLAESRPPILIKIAPDLETPMIDEIATDALAMGLDGIVAANTTIKRVEVDVASSYQGGLSGQPLTNLARGVIGRIYRATRGKVPIIGVGGVASAEDAWAHIRSGASLVEFYTGMIYQGPGLAAAIKMGLRQLLARHGCKSISEVVGADV